MAVRAHDTRLSPKASDTEQRPANTRSRILDVGERLVQVRGFNGFSYADVAAELSVTKASLHYHFPSKAELGEALIVRYAERFAHALAAIDANLTSAPAKLDAYANLYAEVLRQERMCLCGMLAAEYQTLPSTIRNAVVAFLNDNEAWLALVLEHGREDGSLRFSNTAADTARSIVSGLEGAMLVARPYGAIKRFETTAAQLLASLAGTSEARAGADM
ncbi:MAG TPA: TetR/AcrR family transcriptional regulator [Solirubrobacteraceae bacterium]|jgi:TetR/AcrR family transcriptional repressor of nem operon|nr:TetR/AcrR family transcriptional regulator [Solirubrobacteraceae bacterium]